MFGVVLTDPGSEPPVGGWCDAQAYLRVHSGVRSIPTPHPFPDGLADALHAAYDRTRGTLAVLDIFDTDWLRQATAAVALFPLAPDPRVAALLRTRLADLGPRAARYALHLLVIAEAEGIDTAVPLTAIAQAVSTLYEEEVDGHVDLDAFHDGTAAAYSLLEARNPDPHLVLDEALQRCSGEPTVMLIAMAVSLAGDKGGDVLREAFCRAPRLWETPTLRLSMMPSQRVDTTSRGS